MTRHLHIDPFNGIAGDMFLGAMIDLGLSLDQLAAALAPLPVERPYRLSAQRTSRQGVGGVDFKVHLGETADAHAHSHAHATANAEAAQGQGHTHAEHAPTHHHEAPQRHTHSHSHTASDAHAHDHHHDHEHGHDHHHDHGDAHGHTHDHPHATDHAHDHHHTGYRDIMAMIDQLDLPDRGKQRARRVVTALGEAEARVHGMSIDKVHFHEVGAVDSIVDMLGAAVALELLDIDTLSAGPLPLSRGYVRCDHGLMPVPAPATAYLLEGLPTVGVPRTGELITPTGAALVRALCDSFGPPPPMTLAKVGYGAGDRDDPDVPNLLRLILGDRSAR